jgi:hypothetical protein
VGILKYDGGGDIPSTQWWDENFNKVHQFWEENGHCKVIGELACWLSKQRKAHASGGLTEDQQERLEALGVQWIITRGTRAAWEERYNELVAYKQTNGDCNVPQSEESRLGRWLNEQRKSYKKGSSNLTEKRQKRLEALGVQWIITQEAAWEERYNKLVAYRQTNGHCNVPQSEESGLGQWLADQRKSYKKGSSKFTEKRQKRLEALGVQWGPHEATWEERYTELVAYRQTHGHCNVPAREESRLGMWLSNQRTAYKKGSSNLTPERLKRLEELGVRWDRYEAAWEERYNELVAYRQMHDHCDVPQSEETGLGQWLSNQRVAYKKGSSELTEKRQKRLEALGVRWVLR